MISQILVGTGIYELIFQPRLSQAMLAWVKNVQPDIIFTQGYLTYTWLALALSKRFKLPIVYYPTDDWPNTGYRISANKVPVISGLWSRVVDKASRDLVEAASLRFAFNRYMKDEYRSRYGKEFEVLMHCDDPERFRRAEPIRLHPPEIKSIVVTGGFDDSRWPLLLDLEEACQRLNDLGIPARATVLTDRIAEEGYRRVKACRFVELQYDPGHELLPSYLKGADLLYLSETFDPVVAQGYRYSISTKAHLFMFSQRPILVYGHPVCGLVNYANRVGWASVVGERNIDLLVDSLRSLLLDIAQREEKIQVANKVVMRNNDCTRVRELFRTSICASGQSR